MRNETTNLIKGMLIFFFITSCLGLFAQNVTVSGTIVDTSGDPLVGVTVQVKGLETGTITDLDGKFILMNVLGYLVRMMVPVCLISIVKACTWDLYQKIMK